METGRHTFHKNERLCSKKKIAGLIEKGNTIYTPCLKIIWAENPEATAGPAQVAFSVPKKSVRLAVTRNLIRRRLREAYRKNKQTLYDFLDSDGVKISFMVIYRIKEVLDYETAEKCINDMTSRLIDRIRRRDQKC
ncbi:MAG: ribonuclease P protein component [Bacteroidales bacterium]